MLVSVPVSADAAGPRHLQASPHSASVRAATIFVVALLIGMQAWACRNPTPAGPTPPPGVETPLVSNARTWHSVPVPADVQLLRDVACPSDSNCVAVGSSKAYRAFIMATSDRGQTWKRSTVPDNLMGVTGLACPTQADCYAITASLDGPPYPAVLLKSQDGGVIWTASRLHSDAMSISCWGAAACLIVGGLDTGGTAFKTTDGGATWTVSNLARTAATTLDGITCADALHCWAVGRRQRTQEIFATSDGGETWTQQLHDYVGLGLNPAFCISSSRCWSPGGNGILATGDGGQHWGREEIPERIVWLSSVACSSAVDCVAVGNHDFLSTRDGGVHWGLESWPGGVSLNAVACPSFCMVVGDTGVVVSER
jgi:photosystem II stability/assembly factor-like uncharacterized protein